ncbi:hypothetical protein GOY17_05975 [Lysobacter soli]|uniref:hypothetical protein n=1 Tax=Lysobacter soli TaxID=453783 RepID=UPI0012EE8411|nr:hypothetical protein [Lysobacter soli]QGW64507.1 hypothetical protein GOY17_05975 [Lysobacter soli]
MKLIVVPAKAGTQARNFRTIRRGVNHTTVIPAKAGIHFDLAAAAAAAAAAAVAVAIALARHSREGGNPGTFHALPVARQSKEESLAKLPIACGARVTFLCSHKEK